jgi:hypothetical protein
MSGQVGQHGREGEPTTAGGAVDDGVLPVDRGRPDWRVIGEKRSLAMHRLVCERLRADPGLIAKARDRVASWMAAGKIHPAYGQAWLTILDAGVAETTRVLGDPGDQARALRSCSPFAGVLDPRTRFEVLRQTRPRR